MGTNPLLADTAPRRRDCGTEDTRNRKEPPAATVLATPAVSSQSQPFPTPKAPP
eukprot:CAMPEP_0203857712 /NCGR_PEP_ID=MMETSP0359-20131031/10883_1 /ASSEMBLY_ACC=CAM_ASM_000338 /TAXON_ID=268821 /ORGANISM="Scrippsiella Hangoei, Strain SHTV-5" /LENGTH=53 /DNA_ID=CAMNT_0050774437 /DNA_START=360 /DNA_END=521 /DNA_ORIENTATION=-